MDIKSSPEKYPIATGNNTEFEKVEESVEIIKSTENYEFRTTMVSGIVEKEDIKKICEKIGHVKKYALQGFKNRKTLSPKFSEISPYPKKYLKEAALSLKDCAELVEIRE
jgi:pyruvate formate lyase activating enzyme